MIQGLIRWYLDFITPRFVGTAAAVVGIAGGLKGLFGDSGAPDPGNYNWYNRAQQGAGAQSWIDALYKTAGRNGQNGTVNDLSDSTYGPLLAALMRASNTSAPGVAALPPQLQAAYGGMANNDAMYAQLLQNAGIGSLGSLTNAGNTVWNTSLDPQNALHDQILQRVVDQSRAGQSVRGIAMGGVGQGLEDDAVRNFETGWSNELLGRQVQGLTSLERALGSGSQIAGNDFTGASQFYGQIPGALTGAATAPYTAEGLNSSYLSSVLGPLSSLWNSTQIAPFMQTQNQAIPFLNQGNGAGANAFGQAMTGYNTSQNNQATGLESLLTGLKQFGNSSGGNWLNNMWANSGYTSPQYNPANTGGSQWQP